MAILLTVFWVIDALIAYHLYKEAYVVRSNMAWKYKKRFTTILIVIGASVVSAFIALPLACLIAGIPATAAVLYFLLMFIAFSTHKGPWR